MKTNILQKLIHRLNTVPIKTMILYYIGLEKIQKFIWNHKLSWLVKAIQGFKNTAGGVKIPVLKLNCKGIVIKSVTGINYTGGQM